MTDDSALFSLPQQQQLCPLCQQPLVMKSGKNGPFLGCSAYPACHYIKALHQHETAIVRPDGIVFGHTTEDLSLDDLVRQLAEKLHLSV